MKSGMAKNFISFKPKEHFVYLNIKGNFDEKVIASLEDGGLECSYDNRGNEYSIKLHIGWI